MERTADEFPRILYSMLLFRIIYLGENQNRPSLYYYQLLSLPLLQKISNMNY